MCERSVWARSIPMKRCVLNTHKVVCTVSRVTQWSKVVPPNGSEAPLVVKSRLKVGAILNLYYEGVVLNLYYSFKLSKRNVSKKCTFHLHQIRAVEFVSSYSFYT